MTFALTALALNVDLDEAPRLQPAFKPNGLRLPDLQAGVSTNTARGILDTRGDSARKADLFTHGNSFAKLDFLPEACSQQLAEHHPRFPA